MQTCPLAVSFRRLYNRTASAYLRRDDLTLDCSCKWQDVAGSVRVHRYLNYICVLSLNPALAYVGLKGLELKGQDGLAVRKCFLTPNASFPDDLARLFSVSLFHPSSLFGAPDVSLLFCFYLWLCPVTYKGLSRTLQQICHS